MRAEQLERLAADVLRPAHRLALLRIAREWRSLAAAVGENEGSKVGRG